MSIKLKEFITGIADAIRLKKGTTNKISPKNFADEISGISAKCIVPNGIRFTQSEFTSFDASNLDVSKVVTMEHMFDICTSLTSLNLSNWDTSNVTRMYYMFGGCASLTSLDLSGWNTSKVTDMAQMFYNCTSLTSLDLSNWDTSSLTDIYWMFYNCTSLTSLNLSGWDTFNVAYMYSMFGNCTSLTSLDLSNFDTSNVVRIYDMFKNCTSLNKLTLSSKFFNSSSLTTYDFSGASNWTDTDSLATLVEALPTITTSKTIKLATKTKAALTDEQKTTISTKGWTIA